MLLGCAGPQGRSFEAQVQSTGRVQLAGWARVHGEIMIYPNQLANKQHRLYPSCISGHFGSRGTDTLRAYDRKWVSVVGTLYEYDALPNDDNPLFERKLLDGITIPNFCLGRKVLLLERVEAIREPDSQR